MFDLIINDLQTVSVQAQPVNILGGLAPQTGIPTVSMTTPGIVTASLSADGTSVVVAAVAPGVTGVTTVVFSGTSVSGKPFTGSFEVAVLSSAAASEAVTYQFTFGTPTAK